MVINIALGKQGWLSEQPRAPGPNGLQALQSLAVSPYPLHPRHALTTLLHSASPPSNMPSGREQKHKLHTTFEKVCGRNTPKRSRPSSPFKMHQQLEQNKIPSPLNASNNIFAPQMRERGDSRCPDLHTHTHTDTREVCLPGACCQR